MLVHCLSFYFFSFKGVLTLHTLFTNFKVLLKINFNELDICSHLAFNYYNKILANIDNSQEMTIEESIEIRK